MSRLQLTQKELKRQKDQLKSFRRYLPTLNQKKKLLQKELRLLIQEESALARQIEARARQAKAWLGVFAEARPSFELLEVNQLVLEQDSLAGIELPRLVSVEMSVGEYDLYQTPVWVDGALVWLQEELKLRFRFQIALKRKERAQEEFLQTTQRINLFEKVKIPQAQAAIRKINAYLDDQQTIAIGWALGAKKKLALAEGSKGEGR